MLEKQEKPMHLGDGVYVQYDGYHIVLTANVPTTDTIYLDSHTLYALVKFAIQNFFMDAKELFEEQYNDGESNHV